MRTTQYFASRTILACGLRASEWNHFAGAFAFGSLSYAEARLLLTRFGEEVAPALRGPASD
jgi:hypothetical protein